MSHVIIIIETVLFWWVIVALFLALNIYLGSLAYGWYIRRKQKKSVQAQDPRG
jgi:hypothetical protein